MTAPDKRATSVVRKIDRSKFHYGRFFIDLTPLTENADFRLLFAARTMSMLVYGVMTVAISWQVFSLTGSSFQVGLVIFFLGTSMAVGLIFGGTLADHWDRRQLMVASRAIYAVVTCGLLINVLLPVPQLVAIYVLVVIGGFGAGVGAPAQMATTASLLASTQLTAASALTAISVQVGALAGPAIAGTFIAGPGLAFCYATIAVLAIATVVLVVRLPSFQPASPTKKPLQSYKEGWLFVRSSPVIAGLMLIDFMAALCATPFPVFPQLGMNISSDASTVAWLYSAPAAGACLAALASGWLGQSVKPGALLIGAVIVWGLAITMAGASSTMLLILLFLMVAGFSDAVSEILRMALLQSHTPNGLQGRVSSLWLMQAIVTPALGGVQIGVLAQMTSPSTALIIGGMVSVFMTLALCSLWPGLSTIHRRP